MPSFLVLPDYITHEEQASFLSWIDAHILAGDTFMWTYTDEECQHHGCPTNMLRRTSRRGRRFPEYPPVSYKVMERIRDDYDLGPVKIDQKVTLYFDGGNMPLHVDGSGVELTYNVTIQNADKGGVFIYDGEQKHTPEKSLSVFNPVKAMHEVTTVEGSRNRYLWEFRV